MDWQPIESAPKDGRSIILAGFDSFGIDWLNVSSWQDGKWVDDVGSEWGNCAASHWLPFPEPPAIAMETGTAETPKSDSVAKP